MMRRFVVVSHTAPPDGRWPLDDLPGAGGRADVLCRAIAATFMVSHAIRADCEFVAVFAADPARPRAVRIRGSAVRHLNPDERSTAARLCQALQAAHEDPWWKEVQPGLDVAPYALQDVLAKIPRVVLLDRDGAALAALPGDATFVLSDHRHFADAEQRWLEQRCNARVSLGPAWLHTDHAIHVVQWLLDGGHGNR